MATITDPRSAGLNGAADLNGVAGLNGAAKRDGAVRAPNEFWLG